MRYFIAIVMSAAVAAPLAGAQAIDFSQDVWPIFAERCIECHGPDKHKGDLRFDDKEWLGDVEIVAPGKPEESLIYKNINLPLDDDDHMPNEGDPLTREQIILIRLWIMEGAKSGDWKFDPATVVAKASEAAKPKSGVDLVKLAEGVAPAPEEALRAIRDIGGLALPLAQDNNLVRVDMKLAREAAGDAQLALLDPIAGQVTWLGLANTAVTDAGLANVARLPKLTALHLENTKVGDAGLANLTGLTNLEYLNLYGTQVGDAGVQQLAGLKNLKKLYLWQTKATKDGAAKLREALPELEVNLGEELEATAAAPAAAPVAAIDAAKLAVLFDEGSCCATAHAKNEECAHPCCAEARVKGEVCTKCNPGAVAKLLAQ